MEFAKAFDGMVRAVEACGDQLRVLASQISDLWFEICAGIYLQHHDRLPGSDRTARLRKKRRSVVIRWFSRTMKRQCDDQMMRDVL